MLLETLASHAILELDKTELLNHEKVKLIKQNY